MSEECREAWHRVRWSRIGLGGQSGYNWYMFFGRCLSSARAWFGKIVWAMGAVLVVSLWVAACVQTRRAATPVAHSDPKLGINKPSLRMPSPRRFSPREWWRGPSRPALLFLGWFVAREWWKQGCPKGLLFSGNPPSLARCTNERGEAEGPFVSGSGRRYVVGWRADGEYQGLQSVWHKGRLESVEQYVDGTLDGRSFYLVERNGRPMVEVWPYKKGVMDGPFFRLNQDGLQASGTFHGGHRDGWWWDRWGALEKWDHGVLVSSQPAPQVPPAGVPRMPN